MKVFWIAAALLIGLFLTCSGVASARGPAAASGGDANTQGEARDILNMASFWRWHVTYRKPTIPVDMLEANGVADATQPKLLPTGGVIDFLDSEAPPAGWAAVDFDDVDWPQTQGAGLSRLPFRQISSSMICLRGKFTVVDRAAVKDLSLSLEYFGGAVVFLNGKEVWRGNLPAGPLAADTRATPYPLDAYVDAAGQAPQAADKAAIERRTRSSGQVRLPTDSLAKGVNILAIELHRSDYHPVVSRAWDFGRGYSEIGRQARVMWSHLNLLDVRFCAGGTGVQSNVARPEGFQIWVHDIHDRLTASDYGDPNEALRPIVIFGARNGSSCGQAAVGNTGPIRAVRAECSDLQAVKGAATIPAGNVTILYGLPERIRGVWYSDALSATAPDEVSAESDAANLPIWIRVRIPAEAVPGEYAGRLTVSADGLKPTPIPIELDVADWAVPAPKDYRTFVAIYQSPTSLAMHYGVKEWSEEHWRMVDQAWALLGRAGNKLANITVAEHTQFGNDEGMIHFIRKPDGTFDYDLSVFDGFIAIAKKHCGTLDHVALHVWHSGGWETRKADQENTVTVVDPQTGKHEHLQVPEFGTEESKKFYKPLLKACWDHLAKVGLENAMCLGILSDGTAPSPVFKAFDEIWPGGGPAKWTRGLHTSTNAREPYRADRGGGVVVLHEFCYGYGLADPDRPLPAIWNERGRPGTSFRRVGGQEVAPLIWYKTFPEQSLFCNTKGIGRICLDFWPVIRRLQDKDPALNIYNCYPCSSCAQRAPSLYSMTWAGPTGPETTIRYEMLCQGVQDAEADIVLSDALSNHADLLGRELADECNKALVDRLRYMRSGDQSGFWNFLPRCNHYGWINLDRRLYEAVAEVSRKISARP